MKVGFERVDYSLIDILYDKECNKYVKERGGLLSRYSVIVSDFEFKPKKFNEEYNAFKLVEGDKILLFENGVFRIYEVKLENPILELKEVFYRKENEYKLRRNIDLVIDEYGIMKRDNYKQLAIFSCYYRSTLYRTIDNIYYDSEIVYERYLKYLLTLYGTRKQIHATRPGYYVNSEVKDYVGRIDKHMYLKEDVDVDGIISLCKSPSLRYHVMKDGVIVDDLKTYVTKVNSFDEKNPHKFFEEALQKLGEL